MSDIHMARIETDDGTWRAFRAMCIEQDIDVSKRLGALVKETVLTYNRNKRQPRRGSIKPR
jgi:hypothetical protein